MNEQQQYGKLISIKNRTFYTEKLAKTNDITKILIKPYLLLRLTDKEYKTLSKQKLKKHIIKELKLLINDLEMKQ